MPVFLGENLIERCLWEVRRHTMVRPPALEKQNMNKDVCRMCVRPPSRLRCGLSDRGGDEACSHNERLLLLQHSGHDRSLLHRECAVGERVSLMGARASLTFLAIRLQPHCGRSDLSPPPTSAHACHRWDYVQRWGVAPCCWVGAPCAFARWNVQQAAN